MKLKTTYYLIIFSIFLSLLLNIIWFWGIPSNYFIFIHDEPLFMNFAESVSSLHIFQPNNFGSAGSMSVIVTLFDRFYYLIAHYLYSDLHILQRILFFIKVILLIVLPYLGFIRLSKTYNLHIDNVNAVLVSLWYAFCTYSLTYWDTQSFSLTILTCYVLAPIALSYYHGSIFGNGKFEERVLAVLCLFIMSFGLYLFAVYVLFLCIFTLVYLFISRFTFRNILLRIIYLTLLFIPLLSIHSIIPYELSTSLSLTSESYGNTAYGNLNGGLLYQLLMWHSWPIYSYWEPRNIFSYYQYFKFFPSLLAPFILFSIVIIGVIKSYKNKLIVTFMFIYAIFLLLIKGAQSPLGEIYLFLINNFILFNVFRAPDSKFGFGIVVVASLLLLMVLPFFKKKYIVPLMLFVILVQGLPLFTGVAIRGQNTNYSTDRIISVSKEYQEVINYINNNSIDYSYTLLIPGKTFTKYKFSANESHLGQDILSKLLYIPSAYTSDEAPINAITYKLLMDILNNKNLKSLNKFPIQYIIVRKDIINIQSEFKLIRRVEHIATKVFNNSLFTVYAYNDSVPLIETIHDDFNVNSVSSYTVEINNLKNDQKIILNQSYNPNWRIYAHNKKLNTFIEELSFIWREPLFENTHQIEKGYANSWIISPETVKAKLPPTYYSINSDGSINIKLNLYYTTQSLFLNGIVFVCTYIASLIILLIYIKNRS